MRVLIGLYLVATAINAVCDLKVMSEKGLGMYVKVFLFIEVILALGMAGVYLMSGT